MTGSTPREVFDWYASLDKRSADHRPLIESKIADEKDQDVRRELFVILGIESVRLNDASSHIDAFRRSVAEFPDDPLLWCSLSSAYAYLSSDSAQALVVMEKAVEVARRTGMFRRQVLHAKARLYRDMKDYPGLERCLHEIMAEPRSRSADVTKENDFLRNLEPGLVSTQTLDAYAEFMKR